MTERPSPGLGSGDLTGAIRNVRGTAETAERHGNLPLAAVANGSLAVALARAGDRAGADAAISRAIDLARTAAHLGAKAMVSWRYVAMLNILDRPGEATALAAQLLDSLHDDDPSELRREAHQVSADVAAARGDWRAVRRHCVALTELAEDNPSIVAQGLVGAAHASIRFGDAESARRDAVHALTLTQAGQMDSLRASALTVLMGIDAVPADIDVSTELTAIAHRAREGGDTAGAAATWMSLGRWLLEHNEVDAGRARLDSAIASADEGKHVFAWGKALVLRAGSQPTRSALVHDLELGWAALTQVVNAYEDPAGRQEMLIDWRATADVALASLSLGPAPLSDDEAQLAVDIFETTAVDAVREGVQRAGGAPAEAMDSAPDRRLSLESLRESHRDGAFIAFRVLRANEELLAGWRLSVDECTDVRVERFEVRDAAAFEVKLIAERNPGAPTDDLAVWRTLRQALLPSEWNWSGTRLAIVPHGPLWLVPWTALPVETVHGGEPEGDPADLRTALTLSTTTSRKRALPRTVRSAVIAIDPDLAGARADADHLNIRLGDRAVVVETAEALREALDRQPDLLILSAHGTGRGPDWALRLADRSVDIADLTARPLPSLLVAASCMSGRQGLEPWPPSLVAACFTAGVETLVGGIWDLPDLATSEFVRHIVDTVVSDAPAVGAAVRETQDRMRRLARPIRDWAGVVVFEK